MSSPAWRINSGGRRGYAGQQTSLSNPEIIRTGGIRSLKFFGNPRQIVRQTEERIFAV
jgi:hypothetical protein